MDGQEAGIMDAEHIVIRSLAPVRRFSAYGLSALVCVAVALPFLVILSQINGILQFPASWVLLGALGISAFLHLFGVHGAVLGYAWKPFRAKCRAEAGTALEALAGRPLLCWDGDAGHMEATHDCWPTGTAWDGEFLYVLDRGTGARIPLAAVREWRWAADRAGTTGWFAVGSQIDVALARQQASAQDAANRWRVEAGNGLFLSVRDADRPTWQFQTSDEAVLRRWSEILSQAFEGRAAAALSR